MSTEETPSELDRPGDVLMTDLAVGERAVLARHTAVELTAARDWPADMSDRIRLTCDETAGPDRLGVINGGGAA